VLWDAIVGNTIADNTGDGIDFGTEADIYRTAILNNIIADNGGYGINSGLGAGQYRFRAFDYNCLHGNTSGATNIGYIDTDPEHNITDEPWTDSPTQATQADRKTNNDYSISAAMEAAGFPGTLGDTSGTSDTGHLDLGVLQTEDPAGGGVIVIED